MWNLFKKEEEKKERLHLFTRKNDGANVAAIEYKDGKWDCYLVIGDEEPEYRSIGWIDADELEIDEVVEQLYDEEPKGDIHEYDDDMISDTNSMKGFHVGDNVIIKSANNKIGTIVGFVFSDTLAAVETDKWKGAYLLSDLKIL